MPGVTQGHNKPQRPLNADNTTRSVLWGGGRGASPQPNTPPSPTPRPVAPAGGTAMFRHKPTLRNGGGPTRRAPRLKS